MGCDAIIVEAGFAGAILATRLTEDPGRSVVLLEAGPDYRSVENLLDDMKWVRRPSPTQPLWPSEGESRIS